MRHGQLPAAKLGATLIEIAIVIAIMVVSIAALVPLMISGSEEAKLKEAATEIATMARSARLTAVYEGGASQILFYEDGFELVLQQSDAPDQLAEADVFFTERVPETEEQADGAGSYYELADGIKYKIRRWGDEGWSDPEDQIWIFRGSGISEPLAIRFELGEAWLEQRFSVLTAEVEEENYAFP